ncbi:MULTISPECIES: conjugal transfer protein [Bacillus]|uniref:conjugal transfer protein n=1 Tax=Bacillus TaxID=1386 RepID=UPI0010ADD6D1|nr:MULTISPECIES: conjugal transfer protein [Bacillus]MCY7576696.1 conjugal transfer protein [Bacillus pumilus]TKD54542.1 conjugal transfer protein [Bacillus sp. S2(2019)]
MKPKLSKDERKEQRKKKLAALKHWFNSFLRSPDKKVKGERAYRPKGLLARQLGAIAFWFLFIGMIAMFMMFLAVNGSSKKGSASQIEAVENPATKPEAVQFAENFARQYFTWSKEDEDAGKRAERLKPFLVKGLDQQAGLDLDSASYSARFNSAEVYRVEEVSKDKAAITLKVNSTVTKKWEEEVTKTVKDGKKKKKVKEKQTKTDEKGLSKYFVVPVYYKNHQYAVYELPRYEQIDQTGQIQDTNKEKLQSIGDSKTQKEINEFLSTFFSSYATDPMNKLSYVLEDKDVKNGLNGSMNFVKVASADVFSNKGKGFRVKTKVIFEEPETKTQFTNDYDLLLEKRGSRYVVTKIN